VRNSAVIQFALESGDCVLRVLRLCPLYSMMLFDQLGSLFLSLICRQRTSACVIPMFFSVADGIVAVVVYLREWF